jgi:MOSC domain-containing protein YiiM
LEGKKSLETSKIVFLSKGLPKKKIHNGEEYQSGIWKEEVEEVQVGKTIIDGDDVANHDYHGGSERVVCFYPYEHYAHWKNEFGETLTPSAFGENLTATGMKEDEVCIGDVFQIGDAILQVSQGRYPCATINKRNNNPLLLKKIIEKGYTGYFFRVIEEGKITSTSQIKKLISHPKRITVSHIHHLYFHEKNPSIEGIQNILNIEELALQWRHKLLDLKEKVENQQ